VPVSEDVDDDDRDAVSVVGTSSRADVSVGDSEHRERTVLSHVPPSSVDSLLLFVVKRLVVSPFFASRCRSTVATNDSSIILARWDTSDAASLKNVSSSSSPEMGRRSSARRQRSLASWYSDNAYRHNKLSYHRGTARRAVSVQLYE